MNESTDSSSTLSVASGRTPAADWLHRALENWLQRHRLPFNFWIHMAGIPLAVLGLGLFLVVEWYWALGTFALGYALQWLGHVAEGNDLGEWAGIKKLLGFPYVGIAPRWQLYEDEVTR